MSNMPKLQDYADAYWGGDRQKALYDLLFYADSEKGKMDDYIDELSTPEADFVYCCMAKGSHYAYGSQKGFQQAVKAHLHAEFLDMSMEEIRQNPVNPFGKPLLMDVGKMALVICLAVGCGLLNKFKVLEIEPAILAGIPSVLSGLVALDLGNHLISFFRYRKARRVALAAPDVAPDSPIPTFEECLEYFRQREISDHPKRQQRQRQHVAKPLPATTAEEAKAAVKAAGKQNWFCLFKLPLIAVLFFISMVLTVPHWSLGVAACLCCLVLVYRQLRKMGKASAKARDAVSGLPSQDSSAGSLRNRQGLAVFAFILIAWVYVILTVAGVGITIGLCVTA